MKPPGGRRATGPLGSVVRPAPPSPSALEEQIATLLAAAVVAEIRRLDVESSGTRQSAREAGRCSGSDAEHAHDPDSTDRRSGSEEA